MKIGLISDVHGNYPALQQVLSEMPDVDAIYHGGDMVNYNPYPIEVMRTFESKNIHTIQGNHDKNVAKGVKNVGGGPPPELDKDEESRQKPGEIARLAAKWTREQLTESDREFLSELPPEMTIDDGKVKFVHGGPGNQVQRLYPEDYGPELLGDEQVLVLGHTHVQHAERFGDRLIVNPGSVGQPRDGDNRAAYAVLDLDNMTVDLRRTKYPIEEVTQTIRETAIPNQLCEWLKAGRVVLAEQPS